MWKTFKHFTYLVFTEGDNYTPSAYKIAGLVVTGFMSVLTGYDVFHNSNPFDPNAFGMGIAAIWAALGLGERLTHHAHKPDEFTDFE